MVMSSHRDVTQEHNKSATCHCGLSSKKVLKHDAQLTPEWKIIPEPHDTWQKSYPIPSQITIVWSLMYVHISLLCICI